MYYYEVWVASHRFHGDSALTYSYGERLERGTLVVVPLQRQQVVGVVVRTAKKPAFATKSLVRSLSHHRMPEALLLLVDWLKDYYPASLGSLLPAFIPSSLLKTPRKLPAGKKSSAVKTVRLPALTREQSDAVDVITAQPGGTSLLHGDTGSGKTRVYLELALRTINEGRSCLVLTPEIGLTPQLTETFSQVFGQRVTVLHSMLTTAQRRDAWRRVLEAPEPVIVIGTRSALFCPLKNIGLIVMDEVHDNAYKQESAPYYQATRVAAKLANLHKAKLVMGSATPLVADYYTLKQKNAPIARMRTSAIAVDKPADVEVVRLEDREHFTRSAYLSDQLLSHVAQALDNNEQSLIFLNRRGTARVILCRQCGWQALCPNCDITLTYHGDSHEIRCHTCGYHVAAPSQCPSCHNTDITFKSIGTKYLVEELARLFPGARVRRFDTDSAKAERLEQQYASIIRGEVDILIGTQVLSKGLDLPKLSVIGVVLADTSLFIPDFTASELAYQQLTQIMGRVGRGHRHGRVVIQSYHPENAAIQAAVNRDYERFYAREITERQQFGFPPFVYILKLTCLRATSQSAERTARRLADSLRQLSPSLEVAEPSPAFHTKIGGKYKWQIIIKSKRRGRLTAIIKQLPSGWSYDIDPANLL